MSRIEREVTSLFGPAVWGSWTMTNKKVKLINRPGRVLLGRFDTSEAVTLKDEKENGDHDMGSMSNKNVLHDNLTHPYRFLASGGSTQLIPESQYNQFRSAILLNGGVLVLYSGPYDKISRNIKVNNLSPYVMEVRISRGSSYVGSDSSYNIKTRKSETWSRRVGDRIVILTKNGGRKGCEIQIDVLANSSPLIVNVNESRYEVLEDPTKMIGFQHSKTFWNKECYPQLEWKNYSNT